MPESASTSGIRSTRTIQNTNKSPTVAPWPTTDASGTKRAEQTAAKYTQKEEQESGQRKNGLTG